MTRETEQKLVPVEAQIDAFRAWYHSHVGKRITRANAEKAISAMLAAAPPAPSPDTGKMGGEGDQRAAFEAWYCADAAKHGLTYMPAEICSMRDGDGYGPERVSINSKWEGWQACAALSAPVSVGDGEAVAWFQMWNDGTRYPGDPKMWPPTKRDREYVEQMGRTIVPLYTHPSDPTATERMRAALETITEQPLGHEAGTADGDRWRCPSCSYAWPFGGHERHSPDCARIIARAALGEA